MLKICLGPQAETVALRRVKDNWAASADSEKLISLTVLVVTKDFLE